MSDTPEYIGDVGVDSGLMWLGDPCYVMGDDAPTRVPKWGEFVDRTFDPKYQIDEAGVSQPVGEKLGMAVSSGYGDGLYPVYITRNSEGRVATLTVDFLAGDEDEQDESAS
ncbi:DUF4241 domain-containing protein [Kocuria sp. SM24M-10]|uniref:DUF4241 domain-containing protein n=1 Tax=Kocuria sp. SM24M-10 TaxID=1660349 RepID=UPI00064A7F77|nr:DUF4241 domain-containing protein [Kocuria sp. SM24M-10]KLU10629.1 hypothetical protein ABL57_05665 [Kocuria sp. SM24M-10]